MNSTRREGVRTSRLVLREMGRSPVLSRQQEAVLAGSPHDRPAAAIEALVHANLSFVVRVAAQHRHLGLPYEEMVSEGCLGLVQAARRFDAQRGARFITYAVWWIRKAILRASLEHSGLVRPSAYLLKRRQQVAAEERALTRELGRRPGSDELSARLGRPGRNLDSLLRERVTLISLDERPGRDGGPALAETLADPNLEPAEDGLLREEAVDLLRLALASLGTQERTVLEARFGLDGRESRTLREIGEQLRLSRERVRQIEKHGRRKIRDFFCRRTRPREQMRPARPGRSAAAASSAATAATQFRSRGTVPRHPYAMEAAS